MKMIRTVLAQVLLVGLERNIAMPQESITFNSKKKDREYWRIQRKRQTAWWEQENQIQEQPKDKYHEKNSKYREGNREAMRQTQRKRYQREKDKINAKRRERRKQKNKLQLLINQK